jgi:hypothetical protein
MADPCKTVLGFCPCRAKSVRYINNITNEEQDITPPQFRGGILADQMGLGKSLSVISLIASDLGWFLNLPTQISRLMDVPLDLITVKTNLLIVPLSCMKFPSSPCVRNRSSQ